MFKTKPPPRELTHEERIALHQKNAEAFLARSKKGGRIEAQNTNASRASAHAMLAVSYQLSGRLSVDIEADPED